MDVDMRSESCDELSALDAAFRRTVQTAVEEENQVRSTREGQVSAEARVIGERPCGETAQDAPLTRTVAGVLQGFGLTPRYGFSSTDGNIPMSMGIPALTIGRGGPSGRSHAPDEWTDVEPEGVIRSIEIALAIILAVAS